MRRRRWLGHVGPVPLSAIAEPDNHGGGALRLQEFICRSEGQLIRQVRPIRRKLQDGKVGNTICNFTITRVLRWGKQALVELANDTWVVPDALNRVAPMAPMRNSH